jgi:hypothetical protein
MVSVSFSACRCSSVVFTSNVRREKKKSLKTGLWMSIWGCGLPAHCCQPAVAGGSIYALAPQAFFTQSSPVCSWTVLLSCCYKLSPFQAHWGQWHCTRFLRPACLFIVHVGSGSSPLSCGVLPPLPLSQAFLLLVAGHVLPLPPSLARSSLFIYSSVKASPPLLFGTQGAPPSLLCVFIVLIAYYSVSFFFPGGGWSV